jgi:hypothetical protein
MARKVRHSLRCWAGNPRRGLVRLYGPKQGSGASIWV